MRKIILPVALAFTGFALAADIEINGNVDFDFASYFNKKFDPTNAANQDIDLSVTANLDENVSVTVYTNTRSYVTNSDRDSEIRHGLARAIVEADETTRVALKKAGCMTRDSRMKERKKPGQPGARKRFQFSKR